MEKQLGTLQIAGSSVSPEARRTCARGANGSRGFDGHVVPPQTGPQEAQHQANAGQRPHRLQPVPAAGGCSDVSHEDGSRKRKTLPC